MKKFWEKLKMFLILCLPIFTNASIWYLRKRGYKVEKESTK